MREADRISSLPTPAAVALAAKARLLHAAGQAVAERGRFVVALSGGATPLPLFRLLVDGGTGTDVDWTAFQLFWVDERVVPFDDPESNYGTARRVMLDGLPIPGEQIHPIPVDHGPGEAAHVYARLLGEMAGSADAPDTPIFDLVLLGMGSDGHTASIFPGSPAHLLALEGDATPLVVPATAPSAPRSRVTLTAAALNRAREILFLVTGPEKRDAMESIVGRFEDPAPPAALIRSLSGTVTWLLDAAATPADLDPAIRP